MNTDISSLVAVPKGLLYGVGFTVLWVVLALISSTTTYHLAPLIVAGTPGIVDSLERGSSTVRLVMFSAVGLALALVATGILSVSGNLEGPSLLPAGGALLESVVFATAGSLLGLSTAMLVRRR